jgi:hypothetical protein
MSAKCRLPLLLLGGSVTPCLCVKKCAATRTNLLCAGLPTPHFPKPSSAAPNSSSTPPNCSSTLPNCSSNLPNCSRSAQLEPFASEPVFATLSRQTPCNFAPEKTASNLSAKIVSAIRATAYHPLLFRST